MHRRLMAIVVTAGLLGACAEVSRTGPRAYAKLPGDSPVTVFTAASSVPRDFEVVGQILYPDFGRPERYDITSSLGTIQAKARDLGGNGVIIDGKEEAPSGFFAGGTLVRARAIRFGPLLAAGRPNAEMPSGSDGNARDALLELDRLRRERLITDQEYRAKREEILARL